MKFDPFSIQSNRCFNSPEAVVYEYGANISDFWQARLRLEVAETWEGFWRRLFEKRCGNVNVDSLIHISEVFYAVRGASSFFTACLD